jgi:TnpA family transposase
MAHRELLTESQRDSFHAPASDERGMVRHYTLSTDDLALINRRRGDPNRLGFGVMLCYLRFPGRILQQGEQPPEALCAFVAEQLGLDWRDFKKGIFTYVKVGDRPPFPFVPTSNYPPAR